MLSRALLFGCLAAGPLLAAGFAHAGEGYARLEGHGGPIKGVAISADGSRALTASFDYSVGLWDLEDGRLIRWLEGHEAAANAVAFLPGDMAISAGDDFDLILWDLASGEVIRRMEGHQGKLISVALSPDGQTIASSGWDGRAALWPVAGGDPVWLEGHQANVNAAVFAGDGTVFTASYDGTIRHWTAEGREEATLVNQGFGINQMVLSEAHGWLAYGAVDGTVRVVETATGEAVADLTADRKPILAMTATADQSRIAVGDGQGYIMVIDTADWTILHDFHAAKTGPIWALAWDRDRRLLAGGISDEAALWPVAESGDAGEVFTEGPRVFHRDPATMSNGERQFTRKCAICHDLTPGASRRAGPTLYGIFGRRAGSLEGYSYSQALDGAEIVWNDETIDKLFDLGPDHYTPGSKMPMQRITLPEDRADLIAYLREQTAPTAKRQAGETK